MNGMCANCKQRLATLEVDVWRVGTRHMCFICAQALQTIGLDMKVKQPRRLVVSGGAA